MIKKITSLAERTPDDTKRAFNPKFLLEWYIFRAECHLLISSSCVGLGEILGDASDNQAIGGFACFT